MTPSLTSGLGILTVTPIAKIQWAAFLLGGKSRESTSMVSTVTINGKHFSVGFLHLWDACKRGSVPTQAIESTHVQETGRTSFPLARVDKQINCDSSHAILFTHDSHCLPTQSFAGT